MEAIDHRSKLPLYYQLYEILREQILGGRYQPGDMIAPESELIEHYQVSRTTVRQVLDLLVNEGLVYRQRGRGTFVSHRTLEEGLTRIVSFTEDMEQRGFKPGTKVLFSGLVPAPAEIAGKLRIEPSEPLARIERLRLADGEPLSIEESFLVHRFFPGILDFDHAAKSLQERTREYGIRWGGAKQIIRAVQAWPDIARILSLPRKEALLYIERVSFTQNHIPAEYLKIYYRGDRYSLFADLQG
jgi:GntR family transcriptional regulator